MPMFGSKSSPSMRKMEGGGRTRRFGGAGGSSFNISNVFGDPFSLGTLGVAMGGWLMAFVSSVIADVDSPYPNFAWWTLVYMFFCIIGVFVVVAYDSVFTYHVAITGFLSAGMVFTTSAVNSLIYYQDGAKEAGAAGFILLSIVAIIWIFYFGSQPQASHRQTIDSFALHKEGPTSRNSRHMTQSYRPDTVHSANQVPTAYNPAQLAGFETSSPVTGVHPGTRYTEAKHDNSTSAFAAPGQPTTTTTQPYQQMQPQQQQVSAFAAPISQQQQQQHLQQQQQQQLPGDSSVSQPAEYPYKAKAIYSYEANPDDPNEISFNKHEVLEVSDVSGRWWQAKKDNGETGIAPSNYLILL